MLSELVLEARRQIREKFLKCCKNGVRTGSEARQTFRVRKSS